ncbi:MAG: hypothetical protein KDD99_29745 [Bacteroidetes bacterium]|nr:hypothetical protein [Bacteroidota bacterium]
MPQINLQQKTSAKEGKIEIYWFENQHIGLKKTLFHRIYIPLTPFDSGLEYESQPHKTEIVIEWMNLDLKDATNLDGVTLSTTPDDETEISVYVGSAHNPCDIQQMNLKKMEGNLYEMSCKLFIDFEYEGVAENEEFHFTTQLELDPNIKGA